MSLELRGLYAIADTQILDAARLLTAVEDAIAGGARAVQYRDKIAGSDFGQRSGATLAPEAAHGSAGCGAEDAKGRAPGMGRAQTHDAAARLHQAQKISELCRRHGVYFFVNDDVALAAATNAHGVHLGRDDLPLAQARAQLGTDRLIGVSCYNELGRALTAQHQGANYVAFGSFFPSRTKPQAVRAAPDLLREARTRLQIPVVAIGGVTPENGATLIEAGADMLAVVEGVFAQPDIRAAARRYAKLFTYA